MSEKRRRAGVEERRQMILDGVAAGMTPPEIVEYVGSASADSLRNILAELVKDGRLERPKTGVYRLPGADSPSAHKAAGKVQPYAPPLPVTNGRHEPVESSSRRVEIPPYMKGRDPVTIAISYGEDEIDNVIRVELKHKESNWWLAIPIPQAVRLYVGAGIPRWSATQESYTGIEAYRLTFVNGEQKQYGHDDAQPLTIDVRAAT